MLGGTFKRKISTLGRTAPQTEIELALCAISKLPTLFKKNNKIIFKHCLRNSKMALKFE